MERAVVYVRDKRCGELIKLPDGAGYAFLYDAGYTGDAISLTLPTSNPYYTFKTFPPFFEGLLPEGTRLASILKKYKLNEQDYMQILCIVGIDTIGAVTVHPE